MPKDNERLKTVDSQMQAIDRNDSRRWDTERDIAQEESERLLLARRQRSLALVRPLGD